MERGAFLQSLTLPFHCPGLSATPVLLRWPLLILFMYHRPAIPQETFANARHRRRKMNETLSLAGDAVSLLDNGPS